jgi:hypothetical protein
VSWSGIATPASLDWVGLYASDSTADTEYLGWVYTVEPSGIERVLSL